MLNITLQDFNNLLNTHWVDWDGADGNQCFDLAQFWNYVLGGQPFTGATADLIYNQPQNIYTQVPNTPTAVPQAGDLVVWNWPHVGIATGNNSDTNQFEVLEQNDPTNSSCHIKIYPNYDGVIGWLHPNQLPQDQQSTIDQLRTERDTNWNLYQGELTKVQSMQSTIDSLNALTKSKDAQISEQLAQLSSLGSQVTSLTQAKDQAEGIAKQVPTLQEQLTQAQNDRTLCLSSQETQNKKIGQLQKLLDEEKPKTLWGRIKYLFNL